MNEIPPHKYPIWIYASVLAIGFLLIAGFWLLRPYRQAATKILAAEKAYDAGEYLDSMEYYLHALDFAPESRTARKGSASCCNTPKISDN